MCVLTTEEYRMSIKPVRYIIADLMILLFLLGSYYCVVCLLHIGASIVCEVVVSLYCVLYSITIMSFFNH